MNDDENRVSVSVIKLIRLANEIRRLTGNNTALTIDQIYNILQTITNEENERF
jgi:hypothetical protein